MNTKLLTKLSENMNEADRKEVLHLIALAGVDDSPLIPYISNTNLVTRVVELAVNYVNEATARVSRGGTWQDLLGSTDIAIDLQELLKNGATLNYTQAVMLITAALLKGD